MREKEEGREKVTETGRETGRKKLNGWGYGGGSERRLKKKAEYVQNVLY